jgi:two-component system, OmpR family, aerobic respiration control sensor histidine kinase ArcB
MKKKHYDLVYLDVGLPGIKGTEVAERFRAWEQEKGKPETPLVALTAHVDEKNKHHCLASGMNEVLNKPLSNEMTEDICSRYLRAAPSNSSEGAGGMVELIEPVGLVIDLEMGERLIGSRNGALELLATLVEDLPQTKLDLQEAFNQKNWEQLKFWVHKLHGGTCYTPTPRLKSAALALEKDLSGKQKQLSKLYEALILEIDAVSKAHAE